MLTLALKLLLAPALVVGSTLAGRRWGHRVGGVLVCLPIVAGPILLVVWLEHGAAFAAGTARAATLGVVPLALFAVVVAALSRRHGVVVTVLGSWVAVLVADALLTLVRVPAWLALVLVLTGLASALGPDVTGVLSAFPVALTVVCGFALAAAGHQGVVALLRGIVPGLDGFALFLFVAAVTLDRLPAAAAFGLALLASAALATALLLRDRSSAR